VTITCRPFRSVDDMPHILDFIHRMPISCPHVIDLPWRLSSPAINEGNDAAYWEDSNGHVVGFAAWQIYWATLDFFILPDPAMQEVETSLFTWANERFHERDTERGYPLPYWIELRDDDQERQRVAKRHGFLLDYDFRSVVLQHSLIEIPRVPLLPDGFLVRPLKGEQEAAAYAELHRTAFVSDSMTTEWRRRTLHMPQYQNGLDLVVSAPDGSLAGFCVAWLEPLRHIAQIEPIGVHPRFYRLGLGRVLLSEMLRRLKEREATSVIIEPFSDNTAIQLTCKSVGFQQVHTIYRKGKLLK
jgi:mycothiol synthase